MTEQLTPEPNRTEPAQQPTAGVPTTPQQPSAGQASYPQPPAGYVPQPGAYPPPASRGNALAVSGFVIALVGFLMCLIPIVNVLAIVLAVVGLVLAIVGLVKTRKGASRKGLAIAGIVLGVLGGVGGGISGAMYTAAAGSAIEELDDASADLDKMTGDATEAVLADDASVDLGDFKASEDEYGLVTTSLPVKVTNTSDEKQSYDFTIEAVTDSGERIADDVALVNDLAPGQSQTVKVFQFVEEDNLGAMKDATFQVAEASSY